jgi:transcriptional regulator with XRE-family HTH domain
MVQTLEEVDPPELGRRLKVIRVYLGFTLEEVSRRANGKVSKSAVSAYENGHEASLKKFRLLCRALEGADMGALLSSEPDWFSRVWSNPELLVPAA